MQPAQSVPSARGEPRGGGARGTPSERRRAAFGGIATRVAPRRPVPLALAAALAVSLLAGAGGAAAQEGPDSVQPAPDRRPGEGEGPFARLVIRGATLVDGTGAPPRGPVDLVVEGDRIVAVRGSGDPSNPSAGAEVDEGTRVLDASGMYVLPGLVDLHGHIGGTAQGTPAEYVYKLWMGHGITTIRDPGSGNGLEWTLRERARSEANEIVAPRIFLYAGAGLGREEPIRTPAEAREWVRSVAAAGADGIKIRDVYDPAVAGALLEEAEAAGLGSAAHLTQLGVARLDALDAARHGLGTLEHWYGLPEALFADRTVQDFPHEYDYNNEYHRFAQAGRLWRQAARPGSERYEAVMAELLELGLTLDPTFTIYEANRDVMRAREAEWHDRYTLPSLWEFFRPSAESHGSYWFRWTTADEVAWKENFRLWMDFVDAYKDRGGRVTTGSDAGYIYKVYGFGTIREFELLQEAGFHPLEVIRSATLWGAETLYAPRGEEPPFGTVAPGKLADLLVVEENPVQDLKVLYGTGTIRLDEESGEVVRVGGVRWTIKDGILYDAARLRDDVARMVAEAKEGERTATDGG